MPGRARSFVGWLAPDPSEGPAPRADRFAPPGRQGPAAAAGAAGAGAHGPDRPAPGRAAPVGPVAVVGEGPGPREASYPRRSPVHGPVQRPAGLEVSGRQRLRQVFAASDHVELAG